jgi:hypothetical protein
VGELDPLLGQYSSDAHELLGGVADDDRAGGHVVVDDAAGSDDCAVADRDAGSTIDDAPTKTSAPIRTRPIRV